MVEGVEVLLAEEARHYEVSDGEQDDDGDWQEHLYVVHWREAEHTQHEHTYDLEESEGVEHSLGYTSDITVGRVLTALCDEEQQTLPQLIARQRSDSEVEKNSVEHWHWDHLQRHWHHQC